MAQHCARLLKIFHLEVSSEELTDSKQTLDRTSRRHPRRNAGVSKISATNDLPMTDRLPSVVRRAYTATERRALAYQVEGSTLSSELN
jgi:hypothetical protein